MADAFERRKWRPDRAYYKGASHECDVLLFYRDEDGKRKLERIRNYPFYFLIRMEDYRKHREFLREQIGIKNGIRRMERHAGPGEWVRVYVRKWYGRDEFFDTRQEPGERNWMSNARELTERLEAVGIETFEADLSLLHRFLTDHDIRFSDDVRCLYFDLETDDSIPGFDEVRLAENRIVSAAWYDDEGLSGYRCVKKLTDSEEREVLGELVMAMRTHDCMLCWNGSNFDFKVMRYRARRLGIAEWEGIERSVLHADLMLSTMRNAPSGELTEGFSLDAVARRVLGRGKEPLPKGTRTIDLWRNDRELLERYNRRDAELMLEIEKARKFFRIDLWTGAIGSRFANYYQPSAKIEGILLRERDERGLHVRSDLSRGGDLGVQRTQYEGGFVLEPVVGLHEGVATLDFKSLYPSIIRTYNISHETKVEERVDGAIATPVSDVVGCWFRGDVDGTVPAVLAKLEDRRRAIERVRDESEFGSPEYEKHKWIGLAYKVMGLSFYGDFGNVWSKFYDVACARSVTLTGQYYNKLTQAFARKIGHVPLASDTDSLFLKIRREDVDGFMKKTPGLYEEVRKKYGGRPGHVKLDFENYFERIVFVAKKRYFGCLSFSKGKNVDGKLYVRGLEFRKSDTIGAARELQERVMRMVAIERAEAKAVADVIGEMRDRMLAGEMRADEITCYESVNKPLEEYGRELIDRKTGMQKARKDGGLRNAPVPVHVRVAKRMLERGEMFYVGMQVPYVVVSGESPIEAVPLSEYEEGRYDREYYWERVTYPVVERIVRAVWPEDGRWDDFLIKKRGRRIEDDHRDQMPLL